MRKVWAAFAAIPLAGCVMSGSEGLTSNQIDTSSAGSVRDRREALRTVSVVSEAPAGMAPAGEISTRRCHRYFTAAPPTADVMAPDLQVIAFGEGADAIRVISVERKNGLGANCWYVLEATAEMFRKT